MGVDRGMLFENEFKGLVENYNSSKHWHDKIWHGIPILFLSLIIVGIYGAVITALIWSFIKLSVIAIILAIPAGILVIIYFIIKGLKGAK